MAERENTPEEQYLIDKARSKQLAKRAERRKVVDMPLGITSLMDALTIILTYLLQTYGADPVNVNQKEGEMLLPKSMTTTDIADALDVQITASSILVKANAVVNVKNGRVDANAKRDGADGFFIDPLFKKMKDEAKKLKQAEKQGGAKFAGLVFMAAHKTTPYRLLAEVLYTANQAEFKSYTFAVTKIKE